MAVIEAAAAGGETRRSPLVSARGPRLMTASRFMFNLIHFFPEVRSPGAPNSPNLRIQRLLREEPDVALVEPRIYPTFSGPRSLN
jgi:hypothetical protein